MITFSDYYPFGMLLPNRHGSSDKYRYGYNGMEKDDELKGEGNSYSTAFRHYDTRVGRWISLDPLMAKYPHQSPFAAFNDNPIYFKDPTGLEGEPPGGDDVPEKLTKFKAELQVKAKEQFEIISKKALKIKDKVFQKAEDYLNEDKLNQYYSEVEKVVVEQAEILKEWSISKLKSTFESQIEGVKNNKWSAVLASGSGTVELGPVSVSVIAEKAMNFNGSFQRQLKLEGASTIDFAGSWKGYLRGFKQSSLAATLNISVGAKWATPPDVEKSIIQLIGGTETAFFVGASYVKGIHGVNVDLSLNPENFEVEISLGYMYGVHAEQGFDWATGYKANVGGGVQYNFQNIFE